MSDVEPPPPTRRPPDAESDGFLTHWGKTSLGWGCATLPVWLGFAYGVLPRAPLPIVITLALTALILSGRSQSAEETFMWLLPTSVIVGLVLRIFG